MGVGGGGHDTCGFVEQVIDEAGAHRHRHPVYRYCICFGEDPLTELGCFAVDRYFARCD